MSHELLAGMQWQMQQLVSQEEQRWLEVTTLQAKVSSGQRGGPGLAARLRVVS